MGEGSWLFFFVARGLGPAVLRWGAIVSVKGGVAATRGGIHCVWKCRVVARGTLREELTRG